MTELLTIKNLSYQKNRHLILHDANLKIDSGKIIALLGENGAGKTTLMRIMVGIAKNYRGEVAIKGKSDEISRKAGISMTDALRGFGDNTTIGEVREFYLNLFSDFDDEQFIELRKFMKLNDQMKLGELSRGMREKLELALTLSRKVSLYLLDEPFAGIDPMARKRIINSILLWKDPEATMIISDHFVNEIATIIDEVVVIKDQTIYSHKSADDIRSQGQSIDEYYENIYADEGAE